MKEFGIFVSLWLAPALAQAGSLEVCADPSAPAGEAAHHCRLALAKGGLSDGQAFAALVNLGYAQLDLTLAGQAAEAFDAAAALNPLAPEPYIGRARAEEARGRPDAALRDWDRALGLAPDSIDARLGRGAFLLRVGRPEDALESFDGALALDPAHEAALYNRGLTLMALGRGAEAARDFSRVIALDPGDAGARFNRGRARVGLDDEGALADFDGAAALAPEWPAPVYAAGRLLDSLGRTGEADARLKRAFELGYQDPWLLERIRRLGG